MLVRIAKYIGFGVYRRSYLQWSSVIVHALGGALLVRVLALFLPYCCAYRTYWLVDCISKALKTSFVGPIMPSPRLWGS